MQVFTNFPFVVQASCRVGVACAAFVVVARVPGLQREFASRLSELGCQEASHRQGSQRRPRARMGSKF